MRALVVRAGALAIAALVAGGISGCYATATTADPYGPDLVYAAPGVQVIADYNEPIFYSDGLYWRYYGGAWYRSSYYTGGWVYARPPVAIMRIDRPTAYVHYRPHGWAPRPYRGPQPVARPQPAPGGWAGHPAQPAPRGWSGQPAPQAAPRPGWNQPAPKRGWTAPPPAPRPPAQRGGGWHGTGH
jgi:hypothetical protein